MAFFVVAHLLCAGQNEYLFALRRPSRASSGQTDMDTGAARPAGKCQGWIMEYTAEKN